jgi:hypothetical protein
MILIQILNVTEGIFAKNGLVAVLKSLRCIMVSAKDFFA